MTQPALSPAVIRFEAFEVSLQAGELRKRGRRIKLQEQPFQILAMLLVRPGGIVTREEIRQKLWPADTFVDFDHGLNSAVGRLREALNDSAGTPRFIETVPRKGYRFIAQLAEVPPAADTAEPERKRFRRGAIVVTVAGLALLLAVQIGWRWQKRGQTSMSAIEFAPLASLPGEEEDPAVSPDGHQVAFRVRNGRDHSGIFTALVGGEKPLRLTSDLRDCSPAWSPDGREIAFLRLIEDKFEIYTIPALGGTEHKLYTGRSPLAPGLSWSPDGKVLAFSQAEDNARSWITLLSLSDLSTRTITQPPDDFLDVDPRFSPDGSQVAFIRGHIAGVVNDVFITSAAGGEARRLTFDSRPIAGLSWTADGREIVYSSMRGSQTSLWRVPAFGGVPQPVSGAGLMASAPSIAPSSNVLAYQQVLCKDNIWRVELKDEKHLQGVPSIAISEKGSKLRPQFSPDGKRITFESDRLGSYELWSCETSSHNCAQLTALQGTVGTARWSPDGRAIAFEFHPHERAEIYVLDFPGGTPRLVPTIPGADNLAPSWSRDSQWIYFTSKSGAAPFQLWKVPAKGGRPVRITEHGGLAAAESADGRYIYYSKVEASGVWRASFSGESETRVLDQPNGTAWYDWVLSKTGIYYLSDSANNTIVLNFFDFAGKASSTILTLDKPIGWGIALSPDSRSLLFVESEYEDSSIMLVKNFR
jgi:Tol biopolymer transport system component/DNA-binding winged helix-turn-helix (wHTH) protein